MSASRGFSTHDSTPPQPKFQANDHFASKKHLNSKQRDLVALDMKGCYVGPVNVQEFLDEFMPLKEGVSSSACPVADFSKVRGEQEAASGRKPKRGRKMEKQMYKPFVSICLDIYSTLLTNFL